MPKIRKPLWRFSRKETSKRSLNSFGAHFRKRLRGETMLGDIEGRINVWGGNRERQETQKSGCFIGEKTGAIIWRSLSTL